MRAPDEIELTGERLIQPFLCERGRRAAIYADIVPPSVTRG